MWIAVQTYIIKSTLLVLNTLAISFRLMHIMVTCFDIFIIEFNGSMNNVAFTMLVSDLLRQRTYEIGICHFLNCAEIYSIN